MRKTRTDKRDQSNSQRSGCRFRKRQVAVLFLMTCLVCTVSSAGTLKIYPPSKDQAGALRLAQVTQTATREEILKNTALLRYRTCPGKPGTRPAGSGAQAPGPYLLQPPHLSGAKPKAGAVQQVLVARYSGFQGPGLGMLGV